jgi:glycosyltransferase involved in cell wall biosynthesis
MLISHFFILEPFSSFVSSPLPFRWFPLFQNVPIRKLFEGEPGMHFRTDESPPPFPPYLLGAFAFYFALTLLSVVILFFFQHPIRCSASMIPQHSRPVSIIIPSFQRERYLERAIRSALNQTLADIEVLVIDDHSTDSSIAIVEKVMASDRRLRLVKHSANCGTHAARITGVFQAAGQFILSLDPDDEMFPFIAEDALHTALLYGVDVVEFHVMEVLEGQAKQFSFLNPRALHADRALVSKWFSEQQLNWNIWKRLIRRTVYMKALNLLTPRIRGKRIIYAEDKLHIGLVFLVANGLVFLKEPGYVYYRDIPENSESGKQQTKKECLRQLRYVERALKYFYRQNGNLTYQIWQDNPKGLDDKK